MTTRGKSDHVRLLFPLRARIRINTAADYNILYRVWLENKNDLN